MQTEIFIGRYDKLTEIKIKKKKKKQNLSKLTACIANELWILQEKQPKA